jgi:hypothetical protein
MSVMFQLAVAGAHLTGLPLNHQLTELGAKLVRTVRTAPVYSKCCRAQRHGPGVCLHSPGSCRAVQSVVLMPNTSNKQLRTLTPRPFSMSPLLPPTLPIVHRDVQPGPQACPDSAASRHSRWQHRAGGVGAAH